MQCFPLYSILLALNQTRVDFLSLDIEGDELYVLRTIPLEKVDIKMMCVEYYHQMDGIVPLNSYLTHNGFDFVTKINIDAIFRQRGFPDRI